VAVAVVFISGSDDRDQPESVQPLGATTVLALLPPPGASTTTAAATADPPNKCPQPSPVAARHPWLQPLPQARCAVAARCSVAAALSQPAQKRRTGGFFARCHNT